MTAKRKLIGDKKGMVLFSSLLLVSVLMVAGMGTWIAIQNDYKITSNLRQTTLVFILPTLELNGRNSKLAKQLFTPQDSQIACRVFLPEHSPLCIFLRPVLRH